MPSHRRHTLAAVWATACAVSAALCVVALTPVAASATVAARVAVDHGTPLPVAATPTAVPASSAFDVVLTPSNAAGLAHLVAAVSTPGSPEYRQYVSESAYVAQFAPSWSAVDTVEAYFRAVGLTVTYQRSSPLLLHVHGPSSAVAHAFATTLRAARSDAITSTEFAGTATLPAQVAGDVTAIDGLSTLAPPESPTLVRPRDAHPTRTKPAATPRTTKPGTCGAADEFQQGTGSFLPDQQAAAYGISAQWSKGINGAGEAIGIFELANYVTSDVATYFHCFSLAPALSVVNVDGGPTSVDDTGGAGAGEGESDLDIEEAGVLAPGSSLVVYQGTQTADTGVLDTYQAIATADKVSAVTTSWGGCEGGETSTSDMTAENSVFEQMAVQGQSVFAAAGDDGSSDCWNGSASKPAGTEGLAVDDPASQPFVTGVGGLTVASLATGSDPTGLSESVWNSVTEDDEACTDNFGCGGGGGGDSQFWPQPTWQTGDGVPTTDARMVPDLSVMADPSTGFLAFSGGGWGQIGGTSMGAPLMAAVTATADQACGVWLGSLNPTLYAMATSGTGFNDVTDGTNSLFSATHGDYAAGTGYDRATGLGSPDPSTFIPDLCTVAASASTSSVAVTPHPAADLATGAVVAVTVRTAADVALRDATATVVGTEPGGTVAVTALTPATNASGVQTFAVDATTTGTVTLTVSVGPTVIGTTSVTLTSSFTAGATTFTRLHAVPGGLASASESTSTDFAAAVTAEKTLTQASTGTTALNDSTRFHLGVVDGAPAVNCAATTCTIAVDVGGALGLVTNAASTTPTYTNLSGKSSLARAVAANSLSVLTTSVGGAVSYLTTSGQVVIATWRDHASSATFTNLSTRLHLSRASSGTSLTATSTAQFFVATRVGGDVWMLRAGTSNGSANLARNTGYVDTGSGAIVGTPTITRDAVSAQLEIAARTSGGGLVLFGATPNAPTTMTTDFVLAKSGVTAAQFVRGSTTTVSARDDVLALEGARVVVFVDGPNWTPVSVSAVTGFPMSATALSLGTAPLVLTATAVDSVSS